MIKKISTSDLRVGMFVTQVHSSWLRAPIVMSDFKVASQRDIDRLVEYDIHNVSIDTGKGLDVGMAGAMIEEEPELTLEETFEAPLAEFWVNRPVPVDFFCLYENNLEHVLKKGLALGPEVVELFKGRGITKVRVPRRQKPIYDAYHRNIEQEIEERKKEGYDGVYTDPEMARRHLDYMRNFQAINPATLIPGAPAGFDIYLKSGGAMSVAVEKSARMDVDLHDRWIDEDANVLIRVEDKNAYREYLMERTRKSKDTKARVSFVLENSKFIVEGLAENPRSVMLMKETEESVKDITTMIIENPSTFYNLTKLNNYDYYTYTHCVDVATLSLALALKMGITGRADLANLGMGALLHDLGKAQVSQDLINKPGKLTSMEYRKVKHHVILGYEMLKDNPKMNDEAMAPLLQHHEKLTGTGYPNGLLSDQIHIFGRISAIIDFYDAITTERPYKKAYRPFDALALIFKGEEDYDKELIKIFVKLLHEQEI